TGGGTGTGGGTAGGDGGGSVPAGGCSCATVDPQLLWLAGALAFGLRRRRR
ncbi:MAG: hypothetical protein H6Q89_4512, partial [Myxococcaceae bacterium]|nr:hypothetical protein [Myxococcaceae bacterium]